MTGPPGSCCRRVLTLCEDADEELRTPEVKTAVHAVGDQLVEPLKVAVAGRVKSGKSTLVNALIHNKVAPTAHGECTRAVTWFRLGHPPKARLIFRNGECRGVPLEAGQRLPATLGADPAELDRVEVELSSDALENVTVIDTPGLESANDQFSAATRRALAVGVGIRREEEDAADISRRTEEAAGKADALIYVLTGAARRDEVEVLDHFRTHLGGVHGSAVNTIVVLNKADLLGEEGQDPLDQAQRLAKGYAERLGSLAAAVVPTVGLVAETLEAGLFTESHAATLRRLAELDPATRLRLFDNVEWFLETDLDVPRSDREELLSILGLYGAHRCVETILSGKADVAALRSELAAFTGVERLRGFLDDLFARRADVLKAANGLADLDRLALAARGEDGAWLAREVERVRLDPTMRPLATTWAFAQATAHGTELPGDLAEDLRRVALGGGTTEMLGMSADAGIEALQAAAAQGSDRWRRFANETGSSEQQRIADVMCQQYVALWQLAAVPVAEGVGSGSEA